MEWGLSPDVQRIINAFLENDSDDEEQGRKFIDLDYAVSRIKQNNPPWQAARSIGLYASLLQVTRAEPASAILLQNLLGSALEPLEALHGELLPSDDGIALTSAQARLLVHVRYALGVLTLAKGDRQSAMNLLHEVAATKVDIRGDAILEGPGILEVTPDVASVKWFVAFLGQTILGSANDNKTALMLSNNCKETLFLLTEALACDPSKNLAESAVKALDAWAEICERPDAVNAGCQVGHWPE